MNTCYFCRGRLAESIIRHIHRWGERIIVFDDVPAEQCQQCGEVYLEPRVLEMMDRITASDAEPKDRVSVPVFSLAEVA